MRSAHALLEHTRRQMIRGQTVINAPYALPRLVAQRRQLHFVERGVEANVAQIEAHQLARHLVKELVRAAQAVEE